MSSSVLHPYRKTAFLAGMASYLDSGALVTTSIALVLYQGTLGLGAGDIGLLSGLLTITFAIGALFGGHLGDRYGRRRVFTLSLVLYVVGTVVLAAAVAPWMLYIGVVFTGLAIGADLPVAFSLIAEVSPEGKQGKVLSATGMLWLLGAVIPGFLAIGLGPLGAVGGRILYGQLALVAAVVLILRRSTAESTQWQQERAQLNSGNDDVVVFHRLPQLFRGPLLASLIVIGLVYALGYIAVNTYQQFSTYIFVDLVGIPVSEAAPIALVAIPVSIAASLVLMRVADRPSRRVWIAIGAVCGSFAYLVPVVFGPSVPSFVATIVLIVFGATFCGEGMYKVWARELFPTMLRSTAQGISIGFVRAFAGIIAIFTPSALNASLTISFLVLTAITIAAGAMAVFAVPRLQRPPESARVETLGVVAKQSALDREGS